LNADSILGADIDIVKYNLFRYCGNNPVNYVDPQEHSIGLAALLVGGIAGIVLIAIGVISIPLPNPSETGWADIPTFSSSPSISFDFSWEKDRAKEDSKVMRFADDAPRVHHLWQIGLGDMRKHGM